MANLILWNSYNGDLVVSRALAPYQLASWLRKFGYTVKVIDFCGSMPLESLVAITEKHIGKDTIAIGASTTFWGTSDSEHQNVVSWVSNAREVIESKYPKLDWIVGGPIFVSPTIREKWTSFSGYAEDSLLKWLDEKSNNIFKGFRKTFDILTSCVTFQEDDFIQPSECLPIELGRGCQFSCKFCNYPYVGKKKGTYIRNYATLREDLIRNYQEFGTTKYYYVDDTVNEDREKVAELARIAQSLPFELKWVGYCRLDLIWSWPETAQLLKDSGLKSPFFGIESFSQKASQAVGKGFSGKRGKDFLLELKDKWKNDVTWTLSFIAGLPHETPEELETTIKWLIDNEMHCWEMGPLHITRDRVWKSEFSENYQKYGYTMPEVGGAWTNDIWSFQEASDFSARMNIISHPHRKVATWFLNNISNYGDKYEDLMTQVSIGLDRSYYKTRKINFINNYIRYQLDCA